MDKMTASDAPAKPWVTGSGDNQDMSRRVMLKACVDVGYGGQQAVSACLLFDQWTSAQPSQALVRTFSPIAPYVPGQFYRRELPCLLATLSQVARTFDTVVVDGYVWLGEGLRPGLGAYLFEALGGQVAVIGVAKTVFRGTLAIEVQRGQSKRPLYVTAVGMKPETAAQHIAGMHGPYRVPTLLREVDQLSRKT